MSIRSYDDDLVVPVDNELNPDHTLKFSVNGLDEAGNQPKNFKYIYKRDQIGMKAKVKQYLTIQLASIGKVKINMQRLYIGLKNKRVLLKQIYVLD